MSNTLTNLFPDLYEALDVVSREMVGFIPAVASSMKAEKAAIGETVRSPVAPAATVVDIAASATGPDPANQDIGNKTIAITKSKGAPFFWEGEETMGLNNAGTFSSIFAGQAAQSMRALVNLIEIDIGSLYKEACRSYGTAGTAPFGSTPKLGDAANMVKILDDNGTPEGDRHLVINSSAAVNLRSLTQLTNVNEAGADATLRRGELLDLFGLRVGISAKVGAQAAVGAGSSYVSNGGEPIGETSILLKTGTGTILDGDSVTFAGDANKYVVTTGIAAAGSLIIAEPGLVETLAGDVALSIVAASVDNLAFSRDAIAIATRLPALPEGGDSARDRAVIMDEKSGLAFEIAEYAQHRRVSYQIAIAWGFAMIKPEHCAILLG